MPDLDGTGKLIDLGEGYRVTAPGLIGTVVSHKGRKTGTRGPELATPALDQALQACGINEIKIIEMDVQGAPEPATETPVRTADGQEGLVLEVPDLGETVGQVVLAIDEDGIMTWNFPLDRRKKLQTPAVRGEGDSKRFYIKRHIPQASSEGEATKRGLVQIVGRKILKVLVYRVTDPLLGAVWEHFARKWEEKNRPYRIRNFNPGNYLQGVIPDLSSDDWNRLSKGRALLFIHGTNSSSHTGFANFPKNILQDLYERYERRVFAFDHLTLVEDPEQNVDWFVRQIPPNIRLEVDIICHSRGGLVARTLAGGLQHSIFPKVKVRRIIFAGVPNNGTILANADHLTDFVDRYTTVLNLMPPGPAALVASILEGIITVVKVIGHAAINQLPGITASDPGGKFLKRLNTTWQEMDTQYYAIAADYEPRGGLKDFIMDQLADRIFKEKNDLWVPTAGVYTGISATGFPIRKSQVLLFPPSEGVAHSFYFIQPKTSDKLKEWLL